MKKFLAAVLAIVMVLGMTAVTASADSQLEITEPIELTIATCWGTNDSAPNVGADYFKKVVEGMSNGMITVKIAKGTLGAERELIEDTQLGSIEACVTTTGPLGGFVPYADIFMTPYLFKDRNHAYAACDGALGQRIEELCDEIGLKVLDWQIVGTRNIYGVGDEIMTPDDIVGKKIRVMETEMLVALYEHYGAIATPMAYNEIYSALQQHAIDGCQAGLPSVSVNHEEVSDWVAILDENISVSLSPYSEDFLCWKCSA